MARKNKHYTAQEVNAIAKAYVSATSNSIKGADQTIDDFTAAIIEKLEQIAPSNCEDGTYHKRGDSVYPYFRDTVCKDVSSFNIALRMVYCSEPTGVTEQEKINMAVAIHLKKTSKMDYAFKNFVATNWRFYGAWQELKKLPKFRFSLDNSSNHDQDPLVDEDGDAGSQQSSAISSISKESSRGGRGNGSKKAKEKLQKEVERKQREEEKKRAEEEKKNLRAKMTENMVRVEELGRMRLNEAKRTRETNALQATYMAFCDDTSPEGEVIRNELRSKMLANVRAIGRETAAATNTPVTTAATIAQPSDATGTTTTTTTEV